MGHHRSSQALLPSLLQSECHFTRWRLRHKRTSAPPWGPLGHTFYPLGSMINSSFLKMVIAQLANCRKLPHGASFGEFEGPSFMLQIFFSLFRSTLAVHTGHAMQKLSGLPAASLHALGPHPTSRLIAMGFPQSRFSRVIGGDFKLPGPLPSPV